MADFMEKQIINKYIMSARQNKSKYLIILISNVLGKSTVSSDFAGTSVVGDYYSIKQLQEMSEAIISNGFELLCYYNENDFIRDYLNDVLDNTDKDILVINTAKTGISVGRKSLIPAFCELNHIKYLGCDPYVVSFAKDKFHWHLLLNNFQIPVSHFWIFYEKEGWIENERPSVNEKIIAKLNSESCGMGLSDHNICKYNYEFDKYLYSLADQYNQNIIVEKFITGYEVEVPVVITPKEIIALEPIGITFNNNFNIGDVILDYEIRVNDSYVYLPFTQYNPVLSNQLKISAKKAAKIMQLSGICRIDFRINMESDFFITDIATTPFITSNSSIGVCFEKLNYFYNDFFAFIIGLILEKYDLI